MLDKAFGASIRWVGKSLLVGPASCETALVNTCPERQVGLYRAYAFKPNTAALIVRIEIPQGSFDNCSMIGFLFKSQYNKVFYSLGRCNSTEKPCCKY